MTRSASDLERRIGAHGARDLTSHSVRMWGEADVLAVIRLARLLRRANPDLAAAHDAHALSLLALARRCAGLSLPIVFHRRVDVPLGRGPASRWKVNQAAMIICVSHRIGEVVRDGGIDPALIRVVHSGTTGVAPELASGGALRRSLVIPEDAVVLGTVSGLISHKGHPDLLAALDSMGIAQRNVFLLVAGDGPLRKQLEKNAAARGLDARVHFLGEVADLGGLFAAIDLFVHPSRSEGLGSSIVDAFSAGLPVVATNAGGIPELVREGETGFVAEAGNPQSLADAIERALSSPAERSARAGRAQARFRNHLTAEAMADATLGCYRELLAPRSDFSQPRPFSCQSL